MSGWRMFVLANGYIAWPIVAWKIWRDLALLPHTKSVRRLNQRKTPERLDHRRGSSTTPVIA